MANFQGQTVSFRECKYLIQDSSNLSKTHEFALQILRRQKITQRYNNSNLPNGGFDGDLPWYKENNHLKQIQELSSLRLSDDHLYFMGNRFGFCDGSKCESNPYNKQTYHPHNHTQKKTYSTIKNPLPYLRIFRISTIFLQHHSLTIDIARVIIIPTQIITIIMGI